MLEYWIIGRGCSFVLNSIIPARMRTPPPSERNATFNRLRTRFAFPAAAVLCIAVALAVFPASGTVSDESRPLTATCHFAAPDLKTDAAGVTRVTVNGCARQVIPGQPVVPFRTLRLLLPPGCTATGVVARAQFPAVNLPGAWRLELGREPAAFAAARAPHPVAPVSAVPNALAELVSVQRMAGYDLAVIRVYPVAYVSDARTLTFTSVVTVEVALSPRPAQPFGVLSDRIPPSVRPDERQRVAAVADNPEALSAYSSAAPEAALGASAHYLLVTRAALLPAFQPLLDQKTAAGLTVHTETMESITTLFAGVDSAERLRNYIRYAYTAWGVGYVLLGGDMNTVPYRGVYATCSGTVYTQMPSDLYFACLDGSWNHNGNEVWAEPGDGESGGDVDLLAEVCVGRAPVDTAAEVTNFVARCLALEQAPAGRFNACLAGEYLFDASNAEAQGGNALDTLAPAFNGSLCPIAWLDDRPLTAPVWSTADALETLNRAPLLVAHAGHADFYTLMRLSRTDLSLLTNSTPFLLYGTGCHAGEFDNGPGSDCIAEEFVKRHERGAFAVLANTREGWYDVTDESRYSGEFQQRFFERLLADERVPVGVAHALAKQDLLGSVETSGSNMPYRWCAFGITLFGDPHAAVRVPLSLRFRAAPSASVVTWNSWTNRTYSVYRSTELNAAAACIASNVVATPPLNVYTDAVPALPRAFYRVTAE